MTRRTTRSENARSRIGHPVQLRLHYSDLLAAAGDARDLVLQLGRHPRNHDLAFSSRPHNAAAHKQTYGSRNVSFAPYGDHWRQAKRVVVVHLLSARRVDAFAPVREAEAAALVSRARRAAEAGQAVELRELLYGGGLLPDAVARLVRRATGLEKKFDDMVEEWDRFLSEIVSEHKEKRPGEVGDFMDVLLRLMEEETEGGGFVLTDDGIKAVAKDMIVAATETAAVALEWAMAELAGNPRVMAKVQDEIARVVAGDAMHEQPTITEAELNRMVYLRAVVKQVFRLHPPLPLLLPRESMSPAAVKGGRYVIPAKTTLLVNAWAIGRDPAVWDAPEEFRPERFLAVGGVQAQQAVHLRGTDCQLLPFGAGRRVCPGINFALPVMELALASLLRHFDWELHGGARPADLDMVEAPGLSTPPRVPLVLVPKWKAFA
ncbi:hypothetical protein SETIT_2G182800v2 [Setaria italica]|uniref:Cytochrome P450 n=1 Tax=Setaria italica TaxID=4555 RepID=A0A368Q0I8_SETIT|nr:hypothetical protein SETIT_2G182800v2 [Setaria italica]